MYFYSYWLFQRVNLTNIQHLSVKFYVPPFHLFRNFSKVGGGGIYLHHDNRKYNF